jgi:hypothetical protein
MTQIVGGVDWPVLDDVRRCREIACAARMEVGYR